MTKLRMLRISIAIGLLILAGSAIMFYLVGNHGHLMFRPHKTEDWVIWGTASVSTGVGLYLIIKKPRK